MILAGDIGGTHARVAIFDIANGRLNRIDEQVYATREFPNLESVVRMFLKQHPLTPGAACFGVAGPVADNRAHMPNAGWSIDGALLARELGISHAAVINDLTANAYGIAALEPRDFLTINQGDPDARGNAGVISAGTGLGEAGLYFDGHTHRPFASEGGHADFAPGDDLQIELLRFLRAEFGRVSVERVLSGGGLCNIYRFLRDTRRGDEPPWLAAELKIGDAAAAITRAALDAKAALCETALEVFVSIYGAEAGNLALRLMASGGIYIGGGIAVKIAARLASPAFMAAFAAKGRMSEIVRRIPVRVILNDSAALFGAARAAALDAKLLNA
ncbi:MAG TPA: glucokinase [Candidatus Binataceae bacterium]|nr:glucokinase [Candidatus Binataceae bacterium]